MLLCTDSDKACPRNAVGPGATGTDAAIVKSMVSAQVSALLIAAAASAAAAAAVVIIIIIILLLSSSSSASSSSIVMNSARRARRIRRAGGGTCEPQGCARRSRLRAGGRARGPSLCPRHGGWAEPSAQAARLPASLA